MKLTKTSIEGLFIIEAFSQKDFRGEFVKTFNCDDYMDFNIETNFKESYYTISNKNVIRGMHFQEPPYEHNKLVYVINGRVLDVVLDLRKDSVTYKQYFSIELDEKKHLLLYIPKGCAHGFKALEDHSIMMYHVSTPYSKTSDSGILWNSFGFDWNIDDEPIVSIRDQSFKPNDEFRSPF